MSDREVGPRIGGRESYRGRQSQRSESNQSAKQTDDDLDINAYIERTPKTNEQLDREKTSGGWEYSFWIVVIIGVVVVLLILIIWFVFKKDDNVELQRQMQPHAPGGHPNGHPSGHPNGQYYRGPPKQSNQQNQETCDKQNNQESCEKPTNQHSQDNHEDMDDQARANLMKKKPGKRNIGPAPGEIPDNPSVVGIVPNTAVAHVSAHVSATPTPALGSVSAQAHAPVAPAVQTPAVATHMPSVETPQVDALPDIQANAIFNRLSSNLGLEVA